MNTHLHRFLAGLLVGSLMTALVSAVVFLIVKAFWLFISLIAMIVIYLIGVLEDRERASGEPW